MILPRADAESGTSNGKGRKVTTLSEGVLSQTGKTQEGAHDKGRHALHTFGYNDIPEPRLAFVE